LGLRLADLKRLSSERSAVIVGEKALPQVADLPAEHAVRGERADVMPVGENMSKPSELKMP
jgi:hypothetical protein